MHRTRARLALITALALSAIAPGAIAQSPGSGRAPAPVIPGGMTRRPGRLFGAGRGVWGKSNGAAAPAGSNPYNPDGLPRGRVYYGGRYFGSFNNRYYGPQYGNF